VEKCEPNPCDNNATCINDRIRFTCVCPNATEPETAIVGLTCNQSTIFCRILLLCKRSKCKYNHDGASY